MRPLGFRFAKFHDILGYTVNSIFMTFSALEIIGPCLPSNSPGLFLGLKAFLFYSLRLCFWRCAAICCFYFPANLCKRWQFPYHGLISRWIGSPTCLSCFFTSKLYNSCARRVKVGITKANLLEAASCCRIVRLVVGYRNTRSKLCTWQLVIHSLSLLNIIR